MTMDERGKRWMAYMDGQMSASEALEFERSLSPEDQKRLSDEVRLESAICDTLAAQECCPVAVWKNLSLRIKNQSPRGQRIVAWQRRLVGLAASISIVVTSAMIYRDLVPVRQVSATSSLDITEKSLAEFARHTEVPGNREAAQKFLKDHGVDLTLVGIDAANLDPHHPVKFLGACMGSCPKGSIIELRLTCCDQPVKIVILKKDSGNGRMIRRAARCGKVKVMRETESTVTALVGDIHGHKDLLNLLKAPEVDNLV